MFIFVPRFVSYGMFEIIITVDVGLDSNGCVTG